MFQNFAIGFTSFYFGLYVYCQLYGISKHVLFSKQHKCNPSVLESISRLCVLILVETLIQVSKYVCIIFCIWCDLEDTQSIHGIVYFVFAFLLSQPFNSEIQTKHILSRPSFWFRYLVLGLFHQYFGSMATIFAATGYSYSSSRHRNISYIACPSHLPRLSIRVVFKKQTVNFFYLFFFVSLLLAL